MPIDFNNIFNELKIKVTDLAKATVSNFAKQATADAKKFLEESKENLKRWTILLAEGKLTTEDFEWLVLSQKDLAEMKALKQAGLAAIRIEQFRNSLLNLVVDGIFSIVMPK
jgi:hypothetical protein